MIITGFGRNSDQAGLHRPRHSGNRLDGRYRPARGVVVTNGWMHVATAVATCPRTIVAEYRVTVDEASQSIVDFCGIAVLFQVALLRTTLSGKSNRRKVPWLTCHSLSICDCSRRTKTVPGPSIGSSAQISPPMACMSRRQT